MSSKKAVPGPNAALKAAAAQYKPFMKGAQTQTYYQTFGTATTNSTGGGISTTLGNISINPGNYRINPGNYLQGAIGNQTNPPGQLPAYPTTTANVWLGSLVDVQPRIHIENIVDRAVTRYTLYDPDGNLLVEFEVDKMIGKGEPNIKMLQPQPKPHADAEGMVIRNSKGEIIGQLKWSNGVIDFEGDKTEAAKSLFNLMQAYVNADKEDHK